MTEQQIFTYISSVLSLIGLGYLFVQYRLLCMEFFRQDLFRLRDGLFDYARNQNIAFNDPAYTVLRLTINGWIRFAHQRTLWQGLLFQVLLSKADKEFIKVRGFENRWEEAIAGLEPEVRAQLAKYREQLDQLSFRYFVISAPECAVGAIVALSFIVPIKLLFRERHVLRSILRRWFIRTDEAALFYGEQAVVLS